MLLVQQLTSSQIFHNLAILICHLYIGGKFQFGNILYCPDSLNYRLFQEIDSHCPGTISWMAIDLTQSGLEAMRWNRDQLNNSILQLIFLEEKHLFDRKPVIEMFPNYYRLFISHSDIEGRFIPKPSNETVFKSTTNSLALLHNSSTDSIELFLLNDDLTFISQHIHEQIQSDSSSIRIFDEIFNISEKLRKLAVYSRVYSLGNITYFPGNMRKQFLKAFFFAQMNMDFPVTEFIRANKSAPEKRFFRHISQRIYKELSREVLFPHDILK